MDYQCNFTNKDLLTGNVEVRIINHQQQPFHVEIIDNSYQTNSQSRTRKPAAAANFVLNLEKSFGLYDFSIKTNGHDTFEKRYAGRVETGKSSFSDPLMGRVSV